MNKQQKEEQISFFKKIFSNLKFVIISKINNINSNEMHELRKQLHNNKISLKVIKNKLLKIAIKKQQASIIGEYLSQSIAIAWGIKEPVEAAKIFVNFQKHINKTIIKAGFYKKEILNYHAIVKLANTPNLSTSRENIIKLIQFIPTILLFKINQPAKNIIFMIKNITKK